MALSGVVVTVEADGCTVKAVVMARDTDLSACVGAVVGQCLEAIVARRLAGAALDVRSPGIGSDP